jgi:N-methylhydantoinase B/oxoprolinase/acetone carboxylase alpha subunit
MNNLSTQMKNKEEKRHKVKDYEVICSGLLSCAIKTGFSSVQSEV